MLAIDRTFIDNFLALAGVPENAPGTAGEILRWSISNATDNSTRPLFLPRPVSNDQVGTVWYVLPRSPQQERILRDQVKAFLSRPYTEFDGTRGKFDLNDKLDQLVLRHFGSRAFKVYALVPKGNVTKGQSALRKYVNQSLERLVRLLDEQPPRSFDLQRSLQRIRKDFEWALRSRDAEASRKYLDELTSNGRLSQENVWYLRIQRWAALGDWNSIIQHPDLADLLCLRRPSRVTYAVLRAFEAVYLDDPSLDDDALRALLATDGLAGMAGIRLLLDGHLPPDVAAIYARLQALLAVPGVPLVPIQEDSGDVQIPLTGLDLAEELWRTGEFVDALAELDKCEQGGRRLVLLLRICRDAPSPQLIDKVVRELAIVTDDVVNGLREKREVGDLLDWLEAQTVQSVVPESLLDWLVALGGDESDDRLEDILRNHGDSWNCENLSRPEIEAISLQMEKELDTNRTALLLRCLPVIHGLLDGLDGEDVLPVLRVSHMALVLEEDMTTADLTALHSVTDVLLEHVASQERGQVMDDLVEVWSRVNSPRRLTWMLDVVASIKATAAANDNDSLNAILQLLSLVAGFFPGSLDCQLRSITEHLLLGDYDTSVWNDKWNVMPFDADSVPDPFSHLRHKEVGIYCLEAQCSRRMKQALEELGKCRVSVSDAKVCTPALEGIAANSDLMVVITSAAKHAATECIRVNRGDKPVVYVHSTGVSTFLRQVSEHLDAHGL